LRRFVVRPLFWLLALLALGVLGLRLLAGSGFVRERVRQLVEARLSEGLGRAVHVGGVRFTLLPLTLVVEELEIAGDRRDEPPFLRLRQGEASASLRALRSSRLDLEHLSLDGLELNLQFRRDGSDNLPRPGRGRGGGGLEVRIEGLTITEGAIRLDEQRTPFALEAHHVLSELVGLDGGVLDGRVDVEQVELGLPQARPTVVGLAARVRLDDSRLDILDARISAPDLRARARGRVGLVQPTTVHLDGSVEASGATLDRLGWLHGEIEGPARFAGSFDWKPGGWSLEGRAASPRLRIVGFDLESLDAVVRGGADGLVAEPVSAGWAGGRVGGRFAVGLGTGYPAELDLVADRVRIESALGRFGVPVANLRGTASGPLSYHFPLTDAARGQGDGSFTIAGEVDASGAIRPATGDVQLVLAEGKAELPSFRWSAAGQQVAGTGAIGLEDASGHFDLEIASEDVGGLVRLLPFLTPGEIWLPGAGTAQATVALDLQGADYRARVELAGAALEAPGLKAERATGVLVASGRQIDVERLELVRGDAQIHLSGTLPTASDSAAPPLALRLEAHGWPVADAWPWLPSPLPLSGPLTGTLTLGGSIDALRGELEGSLMPAEVLGVAANRVEARLEFDPDRLTVREAHLHLDAGDVEASGTLQFADQRLDVQASASGLDFAGRPLSSLGGGAIAGHLGLDAHVGGTLEEPELRIAGRSTDATLLGRALTADRQPNIDLTWRQGQLDASVELPGVAELRGGGELRTEQAAQLRFALRCESLGDLAAMVTGRQIADLQGGFDADLDVDWPADAAPTARLEIAQGEFRWGDLPLRTVEPIRVRFDENGLDVESVYLAPGDGGGDDELFLGGHIGAGDDPALGLHVQADLAAARLRPWLGGMDLSGRLTLLTDVGGTLGHPELSGQGEWSGGRWIPPVIPHAVERAGALVLFYPRAVVLDHLDADFAGGHLSAGGRLDIARQGEPTYRLEAAARSVTLRWPAGWQLRGDADLTLMSTASGRQLVGQAQLDRVFYVQDIELSPTQLLARLLTRSRVVVPETDEFLASTVLNVAVRAPKSVRVRNNLADLTASADLAIRGTLAQPVLFGEVRSEAGGSVTYAGNRYSVERGVVTFANPTRLDPFLDLVASTRLDQYDVTVSVAGPMSRPVTTFTSDPPLPDLEILGLLSTGAPVDSSIGTLTSSQIGGQSSVGAEALLYSQAASLVGARVGKLFGFDQVRVQPLTAGDTVSAARVTVGKRLSRKVYVTYSYDPSSTAQQILQVEWRLSDRLVLVMTQNGNESYSVDTRWESRF